MYGKMRSLLEEDNKERLLKQLYSNFYCFKKYNNYGNSKGIQFVCLLLICSSEWYSILIILKIKWC